MADQKQNQDRQENDQKSNAGRVKELQKQIDKLIEEREKLKGYD